jgi:hypothetical protein
MPRPRKADSRDYQINVRFSASEYVRVHAHAALTGKSVADFARTVLLRRPRRRTPGIQPTVIALAEDAITEWQVLARLSHSG